MSAEGRILIAEVSSLLFALIAAELEVYDRRSAETAQGFVDLLVQKSTDRAAPVTLPLREMQRLAGELVEAVEEVAPRGLCEGCDAPASEHRSDEEGELFGWCVSCLANGHEGGTPA